MKAFEVLLKGEKLCTAGVGELGAMSAMVSWVRRQGLRTLSRHTDAVEEELELGVGGLIAPTEEHVSWEKERPLQIGDEVTIKIITAENVDEPSIRQLRDTTKEFDAKKDYVRRLAEELGWQIVEP